MSYSRGLRSDESSASHRISWIKLDGFVSLTLKGERTSRLKQISVFSNPVLSAIHITYSDYALIQCLRLELNARILQCIPYLIWVTHAETELPLKHPASWFRWAPHDRCSIFGLFVHKTRLIRIRVHRAIFRNKHTEKGVWVKDHVRVEGKQHWAKGTSRPTPPLPKPHLTFIQRKAAAKLLACAQLFQLYVWKWFKTLDSVARLPTKIVFVPAIEVCFKTSGGLPLNMSDCSEVSCGCKPIVPNVLTFKAS